MLWCKGRSTFQLRFTPKGHYVLPSSVGYLAKARGQVDPPYTATLAVEGESALANLGS